jgi:tRNA G26 N,N-dimethylase Trm1
MNHSNTALVSPEPRSDALFNRFSSMSLTLEMQGNQYFNGDDAFYNPAKKINRSLLNSPIIYNFEFLENALSIACNTYSSTTTISATLQSVLKDRSVYVLETSHFVLGSQVVFRVIAVFCVTGIFDILH